MRALAAASRYLPVLGDQIQRQHAFLSEHCQGVAITCKQGAKSISAACWGSAHGGTNRRNDRQTAVGDEGCEKKEQHRQIEGDQPVFLCCS